MTILIFDRKKVHRSFERESNPKKSELVYLPSSSVLAIRRHQPSIDAYKRMVIEGVLPPMPVLDETGKGSDCGEIDGCFDQM